MSLTEQRAAQPPTVIGFNYITDKLNLH